MPELMENLPQEDLPSLSASLGGATDENEGYRLLSSHIKSLRLNAYSCRMMLFRGNPTDPVLSLGSTR